VKTGSKSRIDCQRIARSIALKAHTFPLPLIAANLDFVHHFLLEDPMPSMRSMSLIPFALCCASPAFAQSPDPAASVKATDWLRSSTEYVVQDLEGAWDQEEPDGGIRHFVSANAALLLANRVQILLSPALGLSPNSPRFWGRLTAAYAF
jgi:hypothetical protein